MGNGTAKAAEKTMESRPCERIRCPSPFSVDLQALQRCGYFARGTSCGKLKGVSGMSLKMGHP